MPTSKLTASFYSSACCSDGFPQSSNFFCAAASVKTRGRLGILPGASIERFDERHGRHCSGRPKDQGQETRTRDDWLDQRAGIDQVEKPHSAGSKLVVNKSIALV